MTTCKVTESLAHKKTACRFFLSRRIVTYQKLLKISQITALFADILCL
ncbi:hypothetical protein HMPREF0673_01238 [Leyella stercorea DSM 18206]|uniref:Uncharacterized protein n=1 Tax=Leyella stercorea DSM 18206 TaxID=1002367 RepID=G6AX88_9BACT|nr:hypothetical protein HMPREF0673_01238 [Leyella stercorea DSM 18206]